MSIEATGLLNAAKQALEAFEDIASWYADDRSVGSLASSMYEAKCLATVQATSLRQAIEQAEKQQIESAVRKSIDEFGHKRFAEAMVERNSDMPKIGCVNHDCDKCQAIERAEKQEPIGTAGELFTNAALERLDFRPSTKIYTTPQPQQVMKQEPVAILDCIKEALPEFRQQDDYLLAHSASLMSDDHNEIIHIDTALRIAQATQHTGQREWVSLTDEQIDQGLCRTPYALKTAEAWREGVRWAYHQLKEKNT